MPRLTDEAYKTILVDLERRARREGFVAAHLRSSPRIPEELPTDQRAELLKAFRLTAEALAACEYP